MTKRTPADTDRPADPPAEGEYEVVTADGERKPATLSERVKAKVRDLTSSTDEQPDWPAELADDQTVVTGNSDIAPTDEQPPAQVMRELRTRAHSEVENRVGMAAAKVAGLVELDRWMRLYATDVQHLASLATLMQQAVETLQQRDLTTAELRGKFRRQIDQWDRDCAGGGS